jgi:hypothetical protein
MRLLLSSLLSVLLSACIQPVDEGSGGGGNRNPAVRSLTADPIAIPTGGLTSITVTADDPDNQPLTYHWSATSGDFLGDGPVVRYTASWCCLGENQIRVTVRDNAGGSASREITVQVNSGGR